MLNSKQVNYLENAGFKVNYGCGEKPFYTFDLSGDKEELDNVIYIHDHKCDYKVILETTGIGGDELIAFISFYDEVREKLEELK